MHPEGPRGHWIVVGEGDTLDALARAAGVPPEDILEANGLQTPAQVRPGLSLFVLEGAAQARRAVAGSGWAIAPRCAGRSPPSR